MHPLGVLLLATVTIAVARPPDTAATPSSLAALKAQNQRLSTNVISLREWLIPRYRGFDESPRLLPASPQLYATKDNSGVQWLAREISRVDDVMRSPDENENDESGYQTQDIVDLAIRSIVPMKNYKDNVPTYTVALPIPTQKSRQENEKKVINNGNKKMNKDNRDKEFFALTPMEKGYFDPEKGTTTPPFDLNKHIIYQEAGVVLHEPRRTRQNPNLSKMRNLVTADLERLKEGLPQDERDNQSDSARHIHILAADYEGNGSSFYIVALMTAVGTVLGAAVLAFAFAWYSLSRKAKAAADVDYPAYGVTGPNVDASGDRKLAQSAHMYHYQHQKQQIIAMERNGVEQRNGSVSDPESEEENEEGDYTVYECPGFATTGDMEVKNPLFSDEPTPTPATPAKCEVVKSQPKE